jgi:predicted phage terminase large subunit-like protein
MNDLDQMVDELAKRHNARSSFKHYCEYVFSQFECSWHHQVIIDNIERMFLPTSDPNHLRRLCVSMPPRHGKSELISRLLPSYILGKNPDTGVMACSYSSELSGRINRDVQRYICSEEFKRLFPDSRMPEGQGGRGAVSESYTRTSDLFEMVGRRGFYRSAGVGGSITGMGGQWLIVDDPIRNRADADSPTIRENILNWYKSTFRTRAEKDARILIVMCMTGDTLVLMADGRQKFLRDIVIGDLIATYDGGRVGVSTVKNWINQGKDKIYTIRMKSGVKVKANERHPFLVDRGGVLEWVRLKNLRLKDKIVKVSGENGKELHAAEKAASGKQHVWDCVQDTTVYNGGNPGMGVKHLNCEERHGLSLDTELLSNNTTKCLSSNKACAQFANNLQETMCERIGVENYVLTTVTTQEKSEDFCATTVISQLGTGKHQKFLNKPLDTYEITLDEIEDISESGYEEVFDIQVDRTENFIANGLVSHNTRWNPEDLVGSVLNTQMMERNADQFEYLCLPAIATGDRHKDDPRAIGEPLWPSKYDALALEQIKTSLGSREFEALYQQNPTAPGATEWPQELFADHIWWDQPWPSRSEIVESVLAIDPSKGNEAKVGDYCALVLLARLRDNTVLAYPIISRMSSEVIVDNVLEMAEKYRPSMIVCETNAFQHLLLQNMKHKSDLMNMGLITQGVHNVIKKEIRIRRLGPFLEKHRIRVVKNSHGALLVDQMKLFPSARYDDGPDALELALRTLINVCNNKFKPHSRGLKT